ncbi:hypothetical protein MBLNU230_g6601t1 [Neophaeotheca triangularis]
MTPTTVAHHGSATAEDYGLDAVAKHNAGVDQFPPYQEDAKDLGFYQDDFNFQHDNTYQQSPPTPRSNTASDGVRTRSGRSTKRTDSPFSVSKSRVSKSPMPRSRKKKASKLDKSKTPKLTAPLSILTKDMEVPVRDIGAWVNRPAEVRRQEVEKRNGYVTRPMNSFMLYRSAYAERTKAWGLQNNHQVVSSVSGESWPMEPQEVRDQFNEWAKVERANHQAAHPEYKFSPSKSNNKRRKGEYTDDEDEPSDLDDPDAEYRGGRHVKVRRQQTPRSDVAYLPSNHFETHPYYNQPVSSYEQTHYPYANPGRPLPSNVAYDPTGVPYDPHTGIYHQQPAFQQSRQAYMPEVHGVRVPTPNSMSSINGQTLGGYGLPGGQSAEEVFNNSRTATPMQQYNQYGQPLYQYQTPQYQQPYQPPSQQAYEHQQYLQQQMQPQHAVDPALFADLEAAQVAGQSQSMPSETQFEAAMGDMSGDLYFDQHTSPDTTLAPVWSPTDGLK